MSQRVPEAEVAKLFDHLIGAEQKRLRDFETKYVGGLEIDD